MTDIIRPGSGIIFMKVGTHAQESLDDIIKRKTKEINDAGFAMWGYGGNTCHPLTMVQPFAEEISELGQPIYLCMQPMVSNHFAEPLRANEYSADNRTWTAVPDGINVLGSRYALVIKNLRREEFNFPLERTYVGVGRTQGRLGSRYIKGHVDKACLRVAEHQELTNEENKKEVRIGLVAELERPYAVFLRDHR